MIDVKTKMEMIREVAGYVAGLTVLPGFGEDANGYVLGWRDASLFVGIDRNGKAFAGGLQCAKVYPRGWVHKLPEVVNGRGEKATAIEQGEALLLAIKGQADLLSMLADPNLGRVVEADENIGSVKPDADRPLRNRRRKAS